MELLCHITHGTMLQEAQGQQQSKDMNFKVLSGKDLYIVLLINQSRWEFNNKYIVSKLIKSFYSTEQPTI